MEKSEEVQSRLQWAGPVERTRAGRLALGGPWRGRGERRCGAEQGGAGPLHVRTVSQIARRQGSHPTEAEGAAQQAEGIEVYPHLVPVVYPLALISQTVSVYLTLTVTLERFVAVCHPLRARSLCTYGRARLYVLVIIALSALYNLPRFWEAEIDVQWDDERNTTVMEVVPTALRRNHLYVTVYINWLYMALLYFLPFTVLAVLNTAIYRQNSQTININMV
ncbi:FMRFamide receptor [Gryllus bimaculatus]|nr:FMRFamide receptor [Gryllus bimaculatus]